MRLNILSTFVLYFCCMPVYSAETADTTDADKCNSETMSKATIQKLSDAPLPVRDGPRVRTSGTVPHVQIGVEQNDALYDEVVRLAFALPDLEKRPTIVSISGVGMWLADDVPTVNQKAIVSGREFAHIHTDGSLHAPLPLERALELEKKGWGERHPWADRNDGWEGLVMLYSASSEEQLATLIQLITESYNHVTGRSIATPVC